MTLRAVFDTNVWIAYELYRGVPHHCVNLAKQERVQLAYCREMTAELARKLRFTFHYPENHIQSVLYELRRLATLVEISGTLRVVPADPDDDVFVECALLWEAEYIVSSDRHLLGLQRYETIAIVTPTTFLALFAEEP